jgi:hypothetical protein
MASRYRSAHQEIRAILQREPHLTAKELWNELTVWPIPSIRTIHRLAQGVKRDLAVGTDLAATVKNQKPKPGRVERPDRFLKEFSNMAAADDNGKLDQIISHLGEIHTKCDGINKRMDSIEEEHKKLRASAESEEEKEKADVAAAAAKGAVRADATGVNRNAFAGAQLKLDSACQAWGHQCRPALAGEALRDYRISILNELKPHSRAYKDSDLSTIGDENAFSNIEACIINDAIQASNTHIAPGAPLTKRTRVNEVGQRITTFHGDAGIAWAPFSGGGTQFGRIVRHPNG